MTADPSTATTTTTTPAPSGTITIGLGPVQQSLLFFLLVALLRRMGILPPPDDDSQDVRYLLTSGSTQAALDQLRSQIAQTRPWCLPQYDQLLRSLTTTGCVVIA